MAWWQNSGNLSYKDGYDNIYTVSWIKKSATNQGQMIFDFTTKILGPIWGQTPQVKIAANRTQLIECEQTTIEQTIQVYGESLPSDYSLTTVSAVTEIVYKYLGVNCVANIKNPFKYGLNNAIIDNDAIGVDGPGCWSDPNDPNSVIWNDVGSGDLFWVDVWGPSL